MNSNQPPYIWDYDIDKKTFQEILLGRKKIGRLNRDWAAVRLIEYAPYREIIQLIGIPALVKEWSKWKERVRSESRKRGLDWLIKWVSKKHPELT